MIRPVVVSTPPEFRREPLLIEQSSRRGVHIREVAGGTTAECAAVCCCCPCGLANFFILCLYKIPTGLCRRALRKRRLRRLLKKKGMITTENRRPGSKLCDDLTELKPVLDDLSEESKSSKELEKEVMELEKEMWERFYNSGFWRSPSVNETEIKV